MTKQEAIDLVTQNGTELKNLSKKFRDDIDVVSSAIHSPMRIENYARLVHMGGINFSDNVQRHSYYSPIEHEIIELASAFQYASTRLRGNKEFCLTMANKNYSILPFVAKELWADKDFVYQAVDVIYWAICFANHEFLSDSKLTQKAIHEREQFKQYWRFDYVHRNVKNESHFFENLE